jgi:hypothetical protein
MQAILQREAQGQNSLTASLDHFSLGEEVTFAKKDIALSI